MWKALGAWYLNQDEIHASYSQKRVFCISQLFLLGYCDDIECLWARNRWIGYYVVKRPRRDGAGEDIPSVNIEVKLD